MAVHRIILKKLIHLLNESMCSFRTHLAPTRQALKATTSAEMLTDLMICIG